MTDRQHRPRRQGAAGASVWKPGLVKRVTTGGTDRYERGHVSGALGVYPSREKQWGGWWVLSHLHTGLFLCYFRSRTDAMKAGGMLNRHFAHALAQRTPGAVLRHLPPWVPAWCRAMRPAGELLPTADFKRRKGVG